MKQVAVIIPIYKTDFSPGEELSLIQAYKQFEDYPIIVVCPEGLEVSPIERYYPRMQYKAFAPKYFKGIEGYNRLMLSQEFYQAFHDEYEYILICQTDAYIFKGTELGEWCDKGYDYIGAPWIKRDCYDLPVMKQWQAFDQWEKNRKGIFSRQNYWNKVGNGGLSLRKVQSFYEAAERHAAQIEAINKGDVFLAEDLYWGTKVPEFRCPDWQEALKFSFDKDPDYCYYVNGGELPFGCHAWYIGKSSRFWLPMLGLAPKKRGYTRYPI